MGKHCTGWIDKIGKCNWSEACKYHDRLYMTSLGKTASKWGADIELFRGVWKVCKPMAFIMWLGLFILPFSYYYWNKYKGARDGSK